MVRLIDLEPVLEVARLTGFGTPADLMEFLKMQPIIDPVKHGYVPKEVLDQIRWERDIAMSYLEEAGIGFGEKAELQRVKHGKWILLGQRVYGTGRCPTHYCSECGQHGWDDYKLCHGCGAKMDGDSE